MMSGALVMADKPFHADDLGLEDGYTYVEINEENWKEKLEYYLEDDQLRETIARKGRENALNKLTHKIVAKKFLNALGNVKSLKRN